MGNVNVSECGSRKIGAEVAHHRLHICVERLNEKVDFF